MNGKDAHTLLKVQFVKFGLIYEFHIGFNILTTNTWKGYKMFLFTFRAQRELSINENPHQSRI